MSVHRASVVVALALVLGAPRSAAAQPAPTSESVARTRGEEGLRRFAAGRWQEAYDLFERASGSLRAPTLVLYMAHCQARLGNPTAAWRLYREVVRAPRTLADREPGQFQIARASARQELRWLGQRLATVKISTTGAPQGQARVLVDGLPVPDADLDELGVEPGAHVVEASLPGGVAVRRRLLAAAGHVSDVVLPMPLPRPIEVGPPDTSAPAPPASPESAPRRANLLAPAGVAFGLGGAALVAGVVTGALALTRANSARTSCLVAAACFPGERAGSVATGPLVEASAGAFVGGGVALASGVVLTVLHARFARRALHVEVGVGLGRGVVGGAF